MNKALKSLDELLDQSAELAQELPGLIHTWRFAVGAIYALYQSYHLAQVIPQRDRREVEYVADTFEVIEAIRANATPPEDWMRGFYYNAAVMRVDVLYERLLRALLNDTSKTSGPDLYSRAHAQFPRQLPELYERSLFAGVREEVNSLKHDIGGAVPRLRERLTHLRNALEHWFTVISDEQVRSLLRDKYGPDSGPVSGRRRK
ncbi:MAG: hypothetical protein FJ106_10540 [Deltaproteobacteria bacterium]|nr:hypothetical protein [Deltaproteobacteria bacterium]